MEPTVLELIELPDGEIALKRVDDDSKPLVQIRFSEESEILLSKMKMTIARAMIEAGMDAFAELNSVHSEDENSSILH